MYKLYDLDMNEIPFPEGVMPLDFLVGSTSKRRDVEVIPGRYGSMNYGFEYDSRPVTINMLLVAKDRIDFQLLRNEIYALFNTHDEFYVADDLLPSRVLKVSVDESFIPEKFNHVEAEVTITCRTLDSVFWESKYTTLELHDSGYSATAEKYGLVDNIDDEKVKYRFTPREDEIIFNSSSFQNGNIHNGGGYDLDAAPEYARTVGFLPVNKNSSYRIVLEETSGNASFVRLFHYNADGSFISNDNGMPIVSGNGKSEYNFTALGENLRLVVYPASGKAISLSDIGSSTKISMYTPSTTNTFSVYNAGNVTIEPESMLLHIFVANVTGSEISIRNNTTDEVFTLTRSMNARHIQVNGMVVTDGAANAFRDTNRRFIRLAPGDNNITVSGSIFSGIRFEFKFLYK